MLTGHADVTANTASLPPVFSVTPPMLSASATTSPVLSPSHVSKTSSQNYATPAQLVLVPPSTLAGNKPPSSLAPTFTTTIGQNINQRTEPTNRLLDRPQQVLLAK